MELSFKSSLTEVPRTYNGLPSVTSILSVLEDPYYIRKWKEAAEDVSVVEKTMEDARKRGTYVHLTAADYYEKGVKNYDEESLKQYQKQHDLPELTPKISKFLMGFDKFVSLHDVLPVAVEEPIASKQLGYAGTLDLIGFHEDLLALVDWKTSSSARLQQDALHRYYIQTSAYVVLWNTTHPDNLIDKIMIPIFTDARASGMGEIYEEVSKSLIKNYFLQFLECKEKFDKLWKLHASYPNGTEILESPQI